MKRTISAVLLAVIALAACGQDKDRTASPTPTPSGQAPDFSLKTPSGETVSLIQHRGKVVLVEFWATWCAPCRESIPALNALHEKYAGRGLVVLGVSIESGSGLAAELTAFSREHRISYPVLLDGEEAARSYGVRSIPTTIVVDKEGRIVETLLGNAPGHAEAIRARIESLL